MSTSFFLSRRSVRPDARSGMPLWQDRLFIFLAQNADDASSYFQLPTDRVVEIGTQVRCSGYRLNGGRSIGVPVPVSHEAP